MKILTINCSNREYSTGQIKTIIENELTPRGCIFYHCYEYDGEPQKKNGYEFLLSRNWLELHISYYFTKFVGLQYGTDSIATFRLLHIIKNVNPDLVHIHCPNSLTINLYRLLNYLKTKRYPTVITNHAEFFFTGNCPHAFDCNGYMNGCKDCYNYKACGNSVLFNRLNEAWIKMRNSLSGFDTLCMVAVSPWQLERMESSTIINSLKCRCICNGVDTDTFCYQKDNLSKKKYGRYIIHVTSFFSDREEDQKGGRYIVDIAKKLQSKKINVLVAGKHKIDKREELPDNIAFLGEIRDRFELANLYSGAILTIMTSKRETFGMPCAESLCCGTPVVGFNNGGSESIALSDYSSFVEYGSVNNLVEEILKWLSVNFDKEKISKDSREVFSNKSMAQKYYELYREMIGL